MKIAISLSGGGLRASAHLGALKFLKEQGVEVVAVAGSSAGAMVALLLALGKSEEEIYVFLKSFKRSDLYRLGTKGGLFSLRKIEEKLRAFTGEVSKDDLQIPLFSCVTNLDDGQSYYLESGDLVANTIASSSLTPMYEPKTLQDGKVYVDGGYSDVMPVKPLKDLGYKILGINVNPLKSTKPKGFFSLYARSLFIMLNANVTYAKTLCDAYIPITKVAHMHLFSFKDIDKAYKAGYEQMKENWEELHQKLV